MIRLHNRTITVNRANIEITSTISKIAEKFELTDIELLSCLSDAQQHHLKYMLRFERHGNYEKKGDEE